MIPKEENGLFLRGKEDMESGSGSELQAEDKPGNEENSSEHPQKRKRYHRHTARQIQELEAVFKECPHPDDKQRMRLSQELGLKSRQVKFWFQNRRTQMKAQQDRSENAILRAENESLKNEFYRLHAELSKLVCPNCCGPPVPGGVSFEELRMENARLGEELQRICAITSRITLVDAFLDANKWNELFPSIVARAKSVQVISPGVSGTNGCLQLMYAELHVLSPLVPTREAYFLRYCQQQNLEDEMYWAIVDFPLNGFHNNLQSSFPLYKRRPSGCLIQDMPNGYSRVTWVEHAEIEEKPIHQIFSHFVNGGMAFGASRWLAVLERQCERIASLMARNISDTGVIPSPEARRNLMRLSQRMIRTFCVNISSSSGQLWTSIPDSSDDTVRVTTRKVSEAGQPNGLILCAVSTTWLPYPHRQVFDLLRDERRRAQLELAMSGEDPSCIPLLPLGFFITPMELIKDDAGSAEEANGHISAGSLLTVGLQVLASTVPTAKVNLSSIAAINNHLCTTVHQISAALSSSSSTPSCPDKGNGAGCCSEAADAPDN
ncbi:hypothetical protein V6N12_046728 [Hibiscus sabdariffa]|uniref:Uncharacterized protein n=1 Tax=Hibiscus sabdariffa TaxID=183260 RepID=A0ABR2ATH8_9ROSI